MGTVTYTASEPVYVSTEGRMVYKGQKFTVPDTVAPGSTWLDEDGNPIEEKKKRGGRTASTASASDDKSAEG